MRSATWINFNVVSLAVSPAVTPAKTAPPRSLRGVPQNRKDEGFQVRLCFIDDILGLRGNQDLFSSKFPGSATGRIKKSCSGNIDVDFSESFEI